MRALNRKWLAGGVVALAGIVAVAGLAYADRDGHRGGGHGMRSMMERYDANKDGNLSQDEIDTNRSQWLTEFDKDKSSDLTIQEFEALWLKARREQMVREFQEFDRDGDGKVTLDEYKEPMSRFIAELDANGDGVLNKEDREMRRDRHRGRERDGDRDDDDDGGDRGDQPPPPPPSDPQ